jgi:hypothetical protein
MFLSSWVDRPFVNNIKKKQGVLNIDLLTDFFPVQKK